uniref:Nuclear envelope pore membrane protein POM 121C n=1 Tax=Malurus cyaneus samueli TaxID=2593467 RepID=A0A8C5X4H3_9PASS
MGTRGRVRGGARRCAEHAGSLRDRAPRSSEQARPSQGAWPVLCLWKPRSLRQLRPIYSDGAGPAPTGSPPPHEAPPTRGAPPPQCVAAGLVALSREAPPTSRAHPLSPAPAARAERASPARPKLRLPVLSRPLAKPRPPRPASTPGGGALGGAGRGGGRRRDREPRWPWPPRSARLGLAVAAGAHCWARQRWARRAPVRHAARPAAPRPPGKRRQRGPGREGPGGEAPDCLLPLPAQATRRRYPLPQARPALPLCLSTARWEGSSPRSAPWARRAGPLRSPVTVRIAPPGAGIARSPAMEQLVSPLAFPATSSPDPCAKETVLNAIRESRKRAVEEEEEEEDQPFGNDQESKRRRHDSSGSGQSAFEPLVANGAPASLIPKPGSLKRSLVSHCPDDCSNKRSRTSSVSSLNNTYAGGIPSSIRNAIASSYSSSRGLAQLWKRSGVSMSPLSSPASSRPQTPEWPLKKQSEGAAPLLQPYTSLLRAGFDLSPSVVMESPVWKKQNSLSPSSTSGSSGKRKRKIPLLSSLRGDQLVLPPPPQLGYSITSEDLDAEKKAVLQWFNSVLEDKAGKDGLGMWRGRSKPRAGRPGSSRASSVLAVAASLPSPSAGQPPVPTVSLESSSLPASSTDTKPVPVLSTPVPSAPSALPVQPSSSLAPPAFTEQSQTPSKPSSFPKPVLFGMLNTPPASQPAVTTATPAPTTATAAPTASTAVPTTATAVPTPPAAVPTTTPTFNFISSESLSLCLQTCGTAGHRPPTASTTTVAGFVGLPNVIFTTAATTATTQSSSTDATIKPVFSFGLNPPASTGPAASVTISAATSTSTAQPFLFGGPANSTPSTETSFATLGSVFQFGKPLTATVTATTSVSGGPAFGQAPSNSTVAATTAGFSIFGSTTLASSAPATTAQAPLTFGSSISAFGSSFSASAKPPPPYPGTGSQPNFSTGPAESQVPASKPAAGPISFTPPFSFGAPPAQSVAQPAFGSGAPPAFGTTSTQGSFGTSSSQTAFGTTTSVFSFGTATSTTSSFGATTQTTSSSTGAAVFGTTPSPFTFGASTQPGPSAGTFGMGTAGLSSGSPAVAFNFGAGQSGAAPAATPFGSSLPQSALGAQGQSTPFAFTMTSTPNNKPVFGGASVPTFGQSTPVPGAVGSGSSTLSFRTPSTPASSFGGVGSSFGSSTPTFSIGAGSKTGTRQRLQARRQHNRKK